MAWSFNIIDSPSYQIDSNYYNAAPLKWGEFSVFIFRFSRALSGASFKLSNYGGGNGRFYLCTSVSDYANSDQVPDNYIAWGVMNSPEYIDFATYGRTIHVVVRPQYPVDQGDAYLSIFVNGGSGGTDPIFTANGSDTDSTITVTVSNLQDTDYDYLYFWVSSSIDSSYTNINPYVFYNIPDGTYDVHAYYVKDNIEHPIYDAYGNRYITITIDSGGGPTPSGDWNYGSPIYLSNLTGNYTSPSAYSFKYDNGDLFVITFAYSGQARFYSSNEYGDMVAFLGDINSGFDNTNGVPIDYDRSSRLQNGFNIDFYSVTAGTPYYLWVTAGGAEKTNWGTFYLNIVVPTAPVVYPTYTYSVNNNSITLNAQDKGSYLLSYKVRLQSDPNDESHSIYYVNDLSYTASNLSWNTLYRINVGYSTGQWGNITWISDPGILISIGNNPQSGYVYIYDGSRWQKVKPYIYDGSRWRPATAYVYDGSNWKKTTG